MLEDFKTSIRLRQILNRAESEQSLPHKYYLKAMVSKVTIAHTAGVHLNHH